ncbi:hypothetical protein RHMOL_Rhmol10G0146600 [Rhododendron molle]|uniref:Uncharacterized protein n=1 Tax=Rhododendron molle TaxID=49168 RepID=A0ACC0M2H2_RHOML|nr:hypothetical protein RHMOL_Rhmol10G0146600 [Rhododendron molle]
MGARNEVPLNTRNDCLRGLEVFEEIANPTPEGGPLGIHCRGLAGALSSKNGAILGQPVQPLDVSRSSQERLAKSRMLAPQRDRRGNAQIPRQQDGVVGAASHQYLLEGRVTNDLIHPLRPVSGRRSLGLEAALHIGKVSAFDAETEEGGRVDQLHSS